MLTLVQQYSLLGYALVLVSFGHKMIRHLEHAAHRRLNRDQQHRTKIVKNDSRHDMMLISGIVMLLSLGLSVLGLYFDFDGFAIASLRNAFLCALVLMYWIYQPAEVHRVDPGFNPQS